MVTLHEVITFLVSMQISISSFRPIMSIDVVEVVIWRESSVSGGSGAVQMFLRWQQRKPRSEERFSRNAETDLVCRLLLEKKKTSRDAPLYSSTPHPLDTPHSNNERRA